MAETIYRGRTQNLLDRYVNHQNRSTNANLGLQLSLGAMNVFAKLKLMRELQFTPTAGIKPALINLSPYNLKDSAIKHLDRSFNTAVAAAREAGKPELISSFMANYQKNLLEIESKQGSINTETRNKEAIANAEALNKAKAFNAELDARNAEIQMGLDAKKTAYKGQIIDESGAMISNISDMLNRNVQNKFKAEYALMPEIVAEEQMAQAERRMMQEFEFEREQDNLANIAAGVKPPEKVPTAPRDPYLDDYDVEEEYIDDIPFDTREERKRNFPNLYSSRVSASIPKLNTGSTFLDGIKMPDIGPFPEFGNFGDPNKTIQNPFYSRTGAPYKTFRPLR